MVRSLVEIVIIDLYINIFPEIALPLNPFEDGFSMINHPAMGVALF